MSNRRSQVRPLPGPPTHGTTVHHNFLGVLGLVKVLAAKDQLTAVSMLQAPLIVTAL